MENIQNLVTSMGIKPTDIVLLQLWGENHHLDILQNFCTEVARLGATPVKLQHSRLLYKNIYAAAPDPSTLFPSSYFSIFDPITFVIDLMAYQPATPHKDFPQGKIPAYMAHMGALFQALSTKKSFIQLRLPTQTLAEEYGIDYPTLTELLTKAYAIDYPALKNTCQAAVEKFNNISRLTITTPKNNQLQLCLGTRPWHKDDGNGDYPSGEIYIAPIENSANGSLYVLSMPFMGNTYQDITLHFQDGKLTTTSSTQLNTALQNLPENGNILCEFGIGLNKMIPPTTTNLTFLDEKSHGTFHIGLGNNTMFGGQNTTPFHTDIVLTGDVTSNGTKLIENGILIL